MSGPCPIPPNLYKTRNPHAARLGVWGVRLLEIERCPEGERGALALSLSLLREQMNDEQAGPQHHKLTRQLDLAKRRLNV